LRDSIAHSLRTLQAGFIALDPNDGEIKAWVGGNDYRTQPYDQVFAQRQTASAFKPILYASALEQGAMPCQYLDNDPIVLTDFEGWQPQNYDRSTGGKYSIAGALSRSMNIPTVNLFFRQDFDELREIWTALGYSQELEYEPAVALGTTSASLFEMSRAYAAFANGGMAVEPRMIRRIRTADGQVLYQDEKMKEPRRILAASTSELLSAILQKAIQEGTGRSMSATYGVQLPLAGKTGTSQDYADSWFLGYSPNLVLASRVGAPYPSIHFSNGSNGSGSALALPIVARTLGEVQRSKGLKKRFFPPFEELPEDYAYALACEDYIDDSDIERMFESVFSSDMTTFEKASKKAKRKARKKEKQGFFKRLFKRDKD
jgi:penicillin-binding protein 1A